jgi:hypothetical protein
MGKRFLKIILFYNSFLNSLFITKKKQNLMKKLLLFTFLVLGVSNSFAQLTCATATNIPTDGTYTAPAITGTYQGNCTGGTAATGPNAIWYTYTATADGEVTISTDLPQNDGTAGSDDTRLSIITGTCAALACYAGSDDVSDTNYLTTLTFPVANGTTYYVVWDDRWSALGFDFTLEFAEPACILPNGTNVLAPSNITVNSAQLNWSAAIGNPASYDVEYGDVDFATGTGTVVNTVTTSASLTGLTPASSDKDYYLRSNCGAEQSGWVGPFRVNLAATAPYSNNFDDDTDYTDGFTASGGWALTSSATLSQSAPILYFSTASTTAATNTSIFSRAMAMQANEQMTVTFYTRLNNGAGTPQTLKVWVNGTPVVAGATQLGADIMVSGNVYVLQTRTFTAPTAGTYYFIFNNASPIVATATNMFLDTVEFTSVLANNQFLASSFSVSPNPARNLVTISNTTDALINNAEVVDMNGRVVKTQKIANITEAQINVSDLAHGVYMVKVSSDRGNVTKKLVIE